MADQEMEVVTTLNHDVAGICRRTQRFMYDLYKSVSSNVAFTSNFDQIRWASYLDAIDSYVSHVQSNPALDLPESHPREISLECLCDEVIGKIENESISDCIYYLKLLIVEISNSASSRLPSGLIKFDEERCRALNEKARRLLEDYVKNVQPLDLPESSPKNELTGAGRKGI